MSAAPDRFRAYVELDARLARCGFHPTTPWWLEQLERFYTHPTAKRLVARVGRGGIKSTTAVKFALCELLFGDWEVKAGERHWAAFASVRADEAGARLRQAEAMCRALQIRAKLVGDELRFEHLPLGMKVFAASVAAVSGPRAVCKVGDELSKWWNDERKANPAAEVIASLRAMSVTHPEAREFLVSSAFSTVDYHHALIEMGETPDQIVAVAPTWVANPSVTEQQTRDLEPDDRIWRREYAAIPSAGVGAAFDLETIDRAFRPRESRRSWKRVLVLDPSSGKKDAWTWGVAGWDADEHDRRFIRFDTLDGLHGRFFEQVNGDEIVRRLVQQICVPRQLTHVHSDQRESLMLKSAFEHHDLTYYVHDWSPQSKPLAVEHVRHWFAQNQVVLPHHDKLRLELLSFEERITQSGHFTFAARGSGHDDYVALLITLAMADMGRKLFGSPQHDIQDRGGLIEVRPGVGVILHRARLHRSSENIDVRAASDAYRRAFLNHEVRGRR